MINENAGGQEQGPVIASAIYDSLHRLRGRACLKEYGHGEVIFQDISRRVQVAQLSIDADFEQEWFRERGFTDEDIQSGMTAVIETEFLNPEWPLAKSVLEPRLNYYNISGNGTVIGERYSDENFQPTVLEPHHLEAIQIVVSLSVLPQQILEHFESYSEFKKALGNKDMMGIDVAESTPTQILYQGGLKEFVRALELRKKGELDRLDTSRHALKDSLDKRDHFTKLKETIKKISGES